MRLTTGDGWSRPGPNGRPCRPATERAPHFAALNNVRAALEWCFGANGNTEIGVGLAAAAAPVFLAMSLLPECHRWSERAILALDDATRGGPEEMHLQAGLGISSMYTMGNSEQSHAALMRGLELAEKLHDPVNQFRLISQLHSFHRRAGNFDRMLAVAQRSEAVAKEMADPIGIAGRAFAARRLASFDRKSGRGPRSLGGGARASARVQLRPKPAASVFITNARGSSLARTLWLAGLSGPGGSVRT